MRSIQTCPENRPVDSFPGVSGKSDYRLVPGYVDQTQDGKYRQEKDKAVPPFWVHGEDLPGNHWSSEEGPVIDHPDRPVVEVDG